MRIVSSWTCPACGTHLTLYIPPHGPPVCAHTGRRALKACAMVPVPNDEKVDA